MIMSKILCMQCNSRPVDTVTPRLPNFKGFMSLPGIVRPTRKTGEACMHDRIVVGTRDTQLLRNPVTFPAEFFLFPFSKSLDNHRARLAYFDPRSLSTTFWNWMILLSSRFRNFSDIPCESLFHSGLRCLFCQWRWILYMNIIMLLTNRYVTMSGTSLISLLPTDRDASGADWESDADWESGPWWVSVPSKWSALCE